MIGDPTEAIAVLVGFSRLLAAVVEPDDVLTRLLDAAGTHLDVQRAAIIGLGAGDGPTVQHVRGLPPGLVGLCSGADDIDAELIQRLIAATGGACTSARTYPLVSGGGLYGALVLLDAGEEDPEAEVLAEALTNLAAVALDKAFHEAELRRTLDDLRQSREALVRAERLRVLGEMAAVVTHEVRNPLAAMGGALQVLEGRLASAPAEQKIVRMVLARMAGLNGMITELLSYARPREPVLAPLDLLELAEDVVEGARADPNARDVTFEVRGEPLRVRGDVGQLQGVVLNLVLNAAQAMGGPGKVTLSVEPVDGLARLAVSDTGPGVPAELREKIFEPFFTTRGAGTGLGLAVARGVVERHQGRLELADTAPGATFQLLLPRSVS